MKTVTDRYDGVTIDPGSLPNSTELFIAQLHEVFIAAEGKKLIWCKLPLEKAEFVPILTKEGFRYHHCDERAVMLVKKLVESPTLPTAKNYTVGVGAIVFQQGNLLVVKDRFQAGYKLPGGHIDNKEEIKTALKREVFEETGVHIEFESIINIGHFTQGQFGESNLYIVCTAIALSSSIEIHDTTEITEARWISVDAFLNYEETNNYNRAVVSAALNNSELKLTNRDITLRIPSGFEVFY